MEHMAWVYPHQNWHAYCTLQGL